MSTPRFPLIGPAALVLQAARQLAAGQDRIALLLEGNPGGGKTHLADQLALELTGSEFAIERVNGQSLGIETVRAWRDSARLGNLFSDWTVKRVDEIDQASSSAMSELLTYLDYLPARAAIVATTNEYGKLRALCKGRLETRFVRYRVDSPSVDDTARFVRKHFGLRADQARAIAAGSVPDGSLPTEGCNVRAAINDAIALRAVASITAVAA